MQRVAILADSIACLTPEMVRQYRLQVIPINIHFDGRIYRDGVDLTSVEAYRLLEKDPERFASSPASVGEYVEAYRTAATYADGILCITLSSRLSTIYDMARTAKEEVKGELPQIPIEVLDSNTAACGEGLIVVAAAQAAAEGMNLTDVTGIAQRVSEKVNVIGIMETVRHVYRTGRIPEITARMGSLLSIKPVFSITDGVVHIAGLTRSKEQALKRALTIMRKKVGNRPVRVAVAHADVPEEGRSLKERIAREFNCVEVWLTDFSPVMGYVTGAGVLAIAFYPDD
ncbi:MAG TPA: DegV family protein [Dehalococcoidales bacterium]